ncbi:MAG: helix-turn-helix domain-containing protein [Chloroflexi bacterium]|nr:helix-turn-helix domain-containing protein [Chloroflexota bacterium]
MTFGAVLRDRRRAAGLTQRDLAERSSLDFSYISKLENNRLPPPAADTVVVLSSILGVPPEELLALTGKIPSEVQATVSTSPSAQKFLREAQRMGLSEDEWSDLARTLGRLRGGDR